MQPVPVHPNYARRYFVLALGWDQPLLDAFIDNMVPAHRTRWAACALRTDNLELLQKMVPNYTVNGTSYIQRKGWLVGGRAATADRVSILYTIPAQLVDGKVWISRWVGSKRSRLSSELGMGLPQAIQFDLEALQTFDQVERWLLERGILGKSLDGPKTRYALNQLVVETKLSPMNHRVRLIRISALDRRELTTVEYSLYWEKTGSQWERRVRAGVDVVEILDELIDEKYSDRRAIFQMMELLSGINPGATKKI